MKNKCNLGFELEMIENIVGKEENASCQHFFPLHTMLKLRIK